MTNAMKQVVLSAALAITVGMPGPARADVIPDRATLNALLGGGGVIEDFERFSIAKGKAVGGPLTHLDSSTVFLGQGPGLVVGGVSFDFGPSLAWNGANYFGLPTRTIEGFSDQSITINFLAPTTAFGVDLFAFAGFPATASATVYDTQGNILDTVTGLPLAGAPDLTFFGYTDAGGIGRVTLSQTGQPWSPILDNVTFGAAVPEPATLTLGGIGMALLLLTGTRRWRS